MTEETNETTEVEEAPAEKPKAGSYRALTGLSYKGRNVEAGEVVDDIPAKSIGWLLDGGHIEKVK